MKLSTRGRYASRMMVDLAEHSAHGPIPLKEIAERQDLSRKYLEQLIIPLKAAGLVRGIRGRRGGFVLARKPEKISVGQILEVVEGEFALVYCVKHPELCNRSLECLSRNIWVEITDLLEKYVFSISLRDILNRSALPRPSP